MNSIKLKQNEQQKCAVSECSNRRSKFSKHCRYHHNLSARYGSPFGYALKKRELKGVVFEIDTFLRSHSEHKAVKAAIAFFTEWLRSAFYGAKVAGAEEFKFLFSNSVTGEECLRAVLTVWLFSYRNYYKLPDDERLTFQLAIAVLSLSPEYRTSYIKGREVVYIKWQRSSIKRAIGKRIREALGVFALNVFQAIQNDLEKEENQRRDLVAPI